jgi:outer membrane protein OmpA-like peptidoglycan-associated protein
MKDRATAAGMTFAPLARQAPGLLLQRKCDCGQHTVGGGKCSSCEKKDSSLQRRAASLETTHEIPPVVHDVLSSPGQPLDTATRAFMESRFRHDFSQVRVHADDKAAESARAVKAKAYTVGSQIVFDTGQFVPGTRAGKNLLAHELTHVLQQSHGLTRSAPAGIGPANDEYEQQADAVARAIVDVPGQPLANGFKAQIPGTHQVVTKTDVPPPPPRVRLQRKSGDEEELLADEPFSPLSQGGGGTTTGTAAGCPKVPTGRGDDIPVPQCPTATHTGSSELERFNFCLDSDELTNPEQLGDVQNIVDASPIATRFLIHGYASSEGRKDYNFRLACHRAIKIANAFRKALTVRLSDSPPLPELSGSRLKAEVESRIETASQGPTNEFGKAESNRVAVVFGQVPGAQDQDPACDKAPRKIGDIKPDIGCDVTKKDRDLRSMSEGEQVKRFHFCLDSDVLVGESPSDIRSFAHKQAASTNFIVHGFSSVEGAADYNQRLSCHRALRIFRELINAGVKQEQITEVGGLGETNAFDKKPEPNRVVVVLAEGGEIEEVPEEKRAATTRKEKEAVRDEARALLLAGKYRLEADAYISFWTCGRTATVRQAVERLTIEVKDTKDTETLRLDALGTEEGAGANFVRLSNVALRADNAIECTMGRIIDMAFHHAVLTGELVPADKNITNPKSLPMDLQTDKDARHDAGLHLIHLAGLGGCTGKITEPRKRGDELAGIDKPLTKDPRADKLAPDCLEAPQSTRLHPPAEGAKGREMPSFNLVGTPEYKPTRGKLLTNFDSDKPTQTVHLITRPDKGVINATASLQFGGQPDTFKDYEVGFIQAVLADEGQADYDSGHSVIQKLPVPIRLGEMKNRPRVPAPWTPGEFKQPNADGSVTVTSTSSGLNTESALHLRRIKSTLPPAVIHSFEQGSRIGIWLAVRRLGAPLDRFSVRFIDGAIYNLTQLVRMEHRRIFGDIKKEADKTGAEEKEIAVFPGSFLGSKVSDLPADPASARLTGPIASEIGLFTQVSNIVEAPAATKKDMGDQELKRVVAEILDNLILFKKEEQAKKDESGFKMPRLGFDYIPLTITLPMVRTTGRLENRDPDPILGNRIIVKVTGPGLGSDAGFALAKALELRIRDRASEGKPVVVDPTIIPGDDAVGEVIVKLEPMKRQPGDTSPETDLAKNSDVLSDMAEAWACTLHTKTTLINREFGRSYAMTRGKELIRDPVDHIKMGCAEEFGVGTMMNLPCPRLSDGITLGGFHTHPEVQIPPRPTIKDDDQGQDDLDFAKDCGSQAFIVSDFKAFRYFKNGKVDPNPISLPKTNTCPRKNLVEDPACKAKGDDLELG